MGLLMFGLLILMVFISGAAFTKVAGAMDRRSGAPKPDDPV